jgi:ABC-type uncharacterized transport system auxiliary subunit
MTMNSTIIHSCLLLSLALLTACVNLERSYPEKRYFALQAQRPSGGGNAVSDAALRVSPFRVSPAFEVTEMVYRRGENEYESDFYNEFFLLPSDMVTEAARRWFTDSGLFQNVITAGSMVDTSLVLEGAVPALYADLRDSGSPKAVLELQALLLHDSPAESPRMIFQKSYSQAVPMEGVSAAAFVASMNSALAMSLQALEEDIRKANLSTY